MPVLHTCMQLCGTFRAVMAAHPDKEHIRCLPLFLTVVYKEQSEQHDSKKKDYDR